MRFPQLSFLGLGLVLIQPALAAASLEDVAINPRSGDTFIIEKHSNPQGELLLLNDHDENFKQVFELLDFPIPSARFEIEMNQEDEVTYVIHAQGMWYLSRLENRAGRWTRQPAFSGLSGEGSVLGMSSLPDGRIALTVTKSDAAQAQVLLIGKDASQADAGYRIIETLSAAAVEKAATEKAASMIKLADDDQQDYASRPGVGFTAGMLSGLGLAYRRHFANKYGIQVGGIGFGDRDSIFGNLGINLLRTLSKRDAFRLYVLTGVSIYYSGDNYADWVCEPNRECYQSEAEWNSSTSLNFGAGIGIEMVFAKHLGLALELPLVVMLKPTGENTFEGIYPIPNASLIYYF